MRNVVALRRTMLVLPRSTLPPLRIDLDKQRSFYGAGAQYSRCLARNFYGLAAQVSHVLEPPRMATG